MWYFAYPIKLESSTDGLKLNEIKKQQDLSVLLAEFTETGVPPRKKEDLASYEVNKLHYYEACGAYGL